jgi:hypothetical protein
MSEAITLTWAISPASSIENRRARNLASKRRVNARRQLRLLNGQMAEMFERLQELLRIEAEARIATTEVVLSDGTALRDGRDASAAVLREILGLSREQYEVDCIRAVGRPAVARNRRMSKMR